MKGDREKCLEAGAWDYISKPIDLDVLMDKITKWYRRMNFDNKEFKDLLESITVCVRVRFYRVCRSICKTKGRSFYDSQENNRFGKIG